jgi:pseudouridine kinase
MKVACIGAVHIDAKARIVGEAHPGTSNPARVVRTPGGVAGNVARNLGRLGLPVCLFSIVGDDPEGRSLLGDLHAASVAAADMEIYDALDAVWADRVGPSLTEFDCWVIDANLPAPAIARLLAYAKDTVVVADPVSVPKATRLEPVLDRVDALFPDRAEAFALAGVPAGGEVSVATAAAALRRRGVGVVVISLGSAGAYADDGLAPQQVAARAARVVVDVTGAGDAQIAGYVYGLSQGGRLSPLLWGMAAASLTVETIDSVRADLTPELLRRRLEGKA